MPPHSVDATLVCFLNLAGLETLSPGVLDTTEARQVYSQPYHPEHA